MFGTKEVATRGGLEPGISVQEQLAIDELEDRGGQELEPVVRQVEDPQAPQIADLGRQFGELVRAETEILQALEIADPAELGERARGQLVVREEQRGRRVW